MQHQERIEKTCVKAYKLYWNLSSAQHSLYSLSFFPNKQTWPEILYFKKSSIIFNSWNQTILFTVKALDWLLGWIFKMVKRDPNSLPGWKTCRGWVKIKSIEKFLLKGEKLGVPVVISPSLSRNRVDWSLKDSECKWH